jgi:hypothetical protein
MCNTGRNVSTSALAEVGGDFSEFWYDSLKKRVWTLRSTLSLVHYSLSLYNWKLNQVCSSKSVVTEPNNQLFSGYVT